MILKSRAVGCSPRSGVRGFHYTDRFPVNGRIRLVGKRMAARNVKCWSRNIDAGSDCYHKSQAVITLEYGEHTASRTFYKLREEFTTVLVWAACSLAL